MLVAPDPANAARGDRIRHPIGIAIRSPDGVGRGAML
jgi:hypothetical protein